MKADVNDPILRALELGTAHGRIAFDEWFAFGADVPPTPDLKSFRRNLAGYGLAGTPSDEMHAVSAYDSGFRAIVLARSERVLQGAV